MIVAATLITGMSAACGSTAITGSAHADAACADTEDNEIVYAAQKLSEREGETYAVIDRGSFNLCSTLSWSLAAVDGATAVQSPAHLLMFHNGEFIALGLPCAVPVTAVESPDPRTVTATYQADEQPAFDMRYEWNDAVGTVDRIGVQPPCST